MLKTDVQKATYLPSKKGSTMHCFSKHTIIPSFLSSQLVQRYLHLNAFSSFPSLLSHSPVLSQQDLPSVILQVLCTTACTCETERDSDSAVSFILFCWFSAATMYNSCTSLCSFFHLMMYSCELRK